ncbi:MAG: hypothetical protein VE98_C0001G0222 [candidate division Kazan bacterium GW2011_GWA1_50_15]|uniref:AN1-type domain-containing protein n=2 Tax=Bacteria division Kazan-3B-28 TaxID=1798534 RepID=A0A0G1X6L8_UNCK3|nr:MAG: hypothetical protein VE98_C0001G0222 [candidate division Kazan bacterium GW2011_GWA1_50_15]KKW25502.1 MAG: hypothetical protein VE99_C0001G0139 [candidate division Kazan bacterium GW2011_GWC1_52_13]KKW26808.1 MAG: hypothetical protein VF00_C0002G0133 [candidate division Kazan bacterium GW2011_GWB1_52_7]
MPCSACGESAVNMCPHCGWPFCTEHMQEHNCWPDAGRPLVAFPDKVGEDAGDRPSHQSP